MINLRNYQEKGVKEIQAVLREKVKHVLYQLPTGGGKTVVFSYMSLSAANKDKRVLIITDREELLKQAGGSIGKFGINCAYIKSGNKFIDYRKNIFVAMSQTLRNRINLPEWREFITNDIDLVIIDEAHIQEFNYLFEDGILKDKIVIGFTATPSRTGNMRQLGLDYERLVRGGEPKDLIEKGYLLNCDIMKIEGVEMEGVKTDSSTGDYNNREMANRFDKVKLYAGIVHNYRKFAEGKKMIVFCADVKTAIKTTIQLNEAGYAAKFVCSEVGEPKPLPERDLFGEQKQADEEKYNEKMKAYRFYKENYHKHSGTRKQVFDGFHADEFKILVNVDIATKGFDEPSVEVVAVMRATKSMTLWLQMIGRGSRLFENKDSFLVLDFGANKERLGGYDDNRNWSLWHETGSSGAGVAPVKECGHSETGKPIPSGNDVKKGCRRLIHASYTLCPFCGYKYPDKAPPKDVELILDEVKDENGISLKAKSFKEMDWEELEKYRTIKKHQMAWLWRQLYQRGKLEEIENYGKFNNWGKQTIEKAQNYCKTVFEAA
ncbi:MAG: DEAD/DEAH box helicase family protein [Bacteroidota bacterium]